MRIWWSLALKTPSLPLTDAEFANATLWPTALPVPKHVASAHRAGRE
jgi:hypothetical protein